jgi:hypothetical protein
MNRSPITVSLSLGISLIALAIGCNREGLPGLGRVTGTITMDGKPVPNALVSFEPVDGSGATAMGRTDEQGKYELWYSRGNKGAKTGEHLVRINTYEETGEDDGRQIQRETIPARYNAKTELKATVKSGSNTLDFELKSGGEIIQPNEDLQPKGKGKGRRRDPGTTCY